MSPPPASRLLCVDAGGSTIKVAMITNDKTGRAAVQTETFARSANIKTVGRSQAAEEILTAVTNVLGAVPTTKTFHQIRIGIAGCDTTLDAQLFAPHLSRWFLPNSVYHTISNDVDLLFSSFPLPGSVAIALIAGTGSSCLVHKRKKPEVGEFLPAGKAGGAGFLLGDEGGGFDIGKRLISAMLVDNDRRNFSSSSPAARVFVDVLAHLKVTSCDHLIERVYSMESDSERIISISGLAKLACDYFDRPQREDPVSHEIVSKVIKQSTKSLVALVNNALHCTHADLENNAIVLGGSLWLSPGFKASFLAQLKLKDTDLVKLMDNPALAGVLALRNHLKLGKNGAR